MHSSRWLAWSLKSKGVAYSLAVIGSAGAGLFLGADFNAHSDINKFNAMLAQHERVPGEVIVKVNKAGAQSMRMQAMNEVFDTNNFKIAEIRQFETNENFYVVKLASDKQTARFLEESTRNGSIAYAEPNYILHAMDLPKTEGSDEVIPNDPMFNQLWAMKNTGQKDPKGQDGIAGADISATKAWALTKGNKKILVGIIDTGMDYNHPKLKDNVYHNPGESGGGKETNGIDDDANGFIDDFQGWNFAGVSTNNPFDDNEHGTHVAGTIGAKGNSGEGVTGVNWEASMMPIKFLTGAGSGTLEDAVKGIQYATLMKMNMTNNSWGGGGFTQTMFDAINDAKSKGILFIAAAGNDAANADTSPHYPAGYQLDNVIAVAATTNRDVLADLSTYGKRTVHIAAPGNNILSSIPGNKYDTFSGTSMATPHVVGAAALVWGTDPSMKYTEVKDRLLRSRDFVPAMARKVMMGGRLNVYNAIKGIYPPSPEPAENDWKDFALKAPVESEHPYKDNSNVDFVVEGPANAKFMRVVFSKVDLESGYDFVKILDGKGTEVDSVTGAGENLASYYVPGNKVMLKLTSDGSVSKWGFSLGKVQVIY